VGVPALNGWPPGPSLNVRAARDAYLVAQGLSADDYGAPRFALRLWRLRLSLPNPATRQRAVPLHDLHHVATGYGSDLPGEAALGAWELRCGCPDLVPLLLNAAAVALGCLVAPAGTLRAFRRARGQRSLYRLGRPYDELLDARVGELRRLLGLPEGGAA
jgi:hypothetical protein